MTGFTGPDVEAWLGWLATYALHSTVLLGGVRLLARSLPSDAWRETAWKAALLGGLVTATLQSATGASPLAGRWTLPLATTEAESTPTTALHAPFGEVVDAPDGLAAAPPPADALGGTAASAARVNPASVPPTDPAREPVVSRSGWTAARSVLAEPALYWLLLAWALGALIVTAGLARQHLRLFRVLRGRRDIRDPEVLAALAELQRSGDVSRPVRLTASGLCPTPLALGRGEICVPERLLALGDEQRRSALAHELAHLVRRDPEWHLATALLAAVFFFQPLNRVARRALREVAEHQCDDWAVRRTGSPLGLVHCLMEVAVWVGADRRFPREVPAMAESGSPLVRRVERLLRESPQPAAPRGAVRAAAALSLVALTALAAPALSLARALPPSDALREISAALPPRVEPYREEVIAHPAPATPLEEKWAWAGREAGSRGHRQRWVAWSFDRALPAGTRIVEDSDERNTDEWSREPLGTLLFGSAYSVPDEARGVLRHPLVVLIHLRGDAIDRVAVRSASFGMDLRGEPVYWLGPTAQAQSLDWLVARSDRLGSTPLEGVMVEAVSLHEDSERVVAFLEGVIVSRRPMVVRGEAVEGLEWHPTERSVRLLRDAALSSDALEIRVEAAEALGEVGGPAAEAALLEVVASSAPLDVRVEAVEAMGNLSSSPTIAAELARIATWDSSESIQVEAVETLGALSAAEAAPLLERIARSHPRPRVQEEAVETLAGVDSEAADQLLEELLRDPGVRVEVRMEALNTLAERRTPRALELVQQAALGDPSTEVQREAVQALEKFAPEATAPWLERLIWENPRSEVRVEAVETAADLPAELAITILDRVLREHGDVEVVREAVDALAELPEELALPLLLRAARQHAHADVREEARDRLERR